MKVSDVVQHADLSLWAEAALVMFLGAFLVVTIRVLRQDGSHASSMAQTPLTDDEPGAEKGGAS